MRGKAYTPNDKLTFGKYRGMTIREILQKDAAYIEWCKGNIDGFSVADEPKNANQREATFYSEGIEILSINPWARKCFEYARRMAEDVILAVEIQPHANCIDKQLQLEFV